MPGRPLTRSAVSAIETLGEDEVFLLYLEHRSVRKLIAAIAERTGHPMRAGAPAYYMWLRAEEGRWERWQEVKAMRGDAALDEVEELADDTSGANVQVNRVKIDAKRWLAEKLNRRDYGKEPGLSVTINAQNAWLGALQEAERLEGKPEVQGRPVTDGEEGQDADYVIVEDGKE